jgi:hypothetical protein
VGPEADFEQDLREGLIAALPLRTSEREAVALRSTEQLVIDHLTWASRRISRRARRVHLSDAARRGGAITDPGVGRGLQHVLLQARTGQDLTPHLSRQTRFAYAWRRRSGQPLRLGLDRLLHAWGVHHLHLGTRIEEDGFIERTEPVLMAVVRPDDFYAVDVVPHDDADPLWTVNVDLLTTIARTWPDAGLIHQVHGAVGLAGPHHIPTDRLVLRRTGISSCVAIDGDVFLPGSLSLAGHPLAFGERATSVMVGVQDLQALMSQDGGRWYRDLVAENITSPVPEHPKWTLGLKEGAVTLTEHVSGLVARLSYLTLVPWS